MEMTQYLEINGIGIAVLLIMILYTFRARQDTHAGEQKYFIRLLYANTAILAADCGIYLLRWHSAFPLIPINHGVCCLFFLLHGYFGYMWLSYSIQKLYPERTLPRAVRLLMLVPMVIVVPIILSSPWTGWVYTLSAQNRYARGPLIGVVVALSYIYWGASLVMTLKECIHPKRIREKSVYAILLVFPLPTLAGNLLQMWFYGLSLVWICSALSLLMLFINIQNYQLSRDMLTGLFNRRETDLQLLWEVNHLPSANDFMFVMMADVDEFKKINDRYGHLTGDEALVTVASILRKSCREKDFIGRFGGDEFVVLGHVKGEENVKKLMENVRKNLNTFNHISTGFKLSLSMGYALYTKEDHPTVDTLLSASDQAMYQVKSATKGLDRERTAC